VCGGAAPDRRSFVWILSLYPVQTPNTRQGPSPNMIKHRRMIDVGRVLYRVTAAAGGPHVSCAARHLRCLVL
jgi:hypothetical protein